LIQEQPSSKTSTGFGASPDGEEQLEHGQHVDLDLDLDSAVGEEQLEHGQVLSQVLLSFFGDKLKRKSLAALVMVPQRLARMTHVCWPSALPSPIVNEMTDILGRLVELQDEVSEVLEFGIRRNLNRMHYLDFLDGILVSTEVAIHKLAKSNYSRDPLSCSLFLANNYQHLAANFSEKLPFLCEYIDVEEKIKEYKDQVKKYVAVFKWTAWGESLDKLTCEPLGIGRVTEILEFFYDSLNTNCDLYRVLQIPDRELMTLIRNDVIGTVTNMIHKFIVYHETVLDTAPSGIVQLETEGVS